MSRKAMLSDLKRSGLPPSVAKKAKYKILTAKQVDELTGNFAAGYLIPYHDINGKVVPNFWRVRYLEQPTGGFGQKPKKELRYTGPKGEVPRFYFPNSVDWKALAKAADEPLIITEGEKKAEKACYEGLPCFSVPGVWAWRSKKEGLAAVHDFDVIEWKKRPVMLCFDNDVMQNPQVVAALNALAHELTNRGAVVSVKFLPKGPGKIGLDDYLLTRNAEAFIKLREEPYEENKHVWTLNERLAFVEAIGAVYDFEASRFIKNKNDLLFTFADLTYMVPKANGEGFKEENAASTWLKWPQKRRYEDVCYRPGDDDVVDGKINLWKGWGVEPKKGSVKPFHDLLNFVFAGDDKLRAWFLQWLAYPLQNPGAKNLTAVLLHSRAQGVGKSFIGYIMGDIYGANFVVIDHEALKGNFNGWAVNKQFILGEEITGTHSRGAADRLKNMITREQIHVNIKYQPEYDIEDCVNYLLTSNHVDALFLEEADRRAVVHNIRSDPKPHEWYDAISKWRANGGAAHVFYYLINDVDLSDYNPTRPAPTTAAKREMIELSKSDVDLAVDLLRDNPDDVLQVAGNVVPGPFFTPTQLQNFVNNYTGGNSTITAVSKSLIRAGFVKKTVRTKAGPKRLFCIRDPDAWVKKTANEWGAEHDKTIKLKKF